MPVLNTGLATPARGFTLDQSLRFEFGDGAYLSRTTTSTGSNYTATLSAWVKRVKNGVRQTFFAGWESSSERMNCYFLDDCLTMQIFTGGVAHDLKSNAVFRDPSAWYHVVFQFNTSSGTESERFKMFVNGVQVTSFAVDDTIGQNIEMKMWGSTSQVTLVGGQKGTTVDNFFDGYMAEVHIIDGTVYAPSEFGEAGDYGEWKPKKVAGLTYGTNGTYLSFAGGGIIAATGGTITTDGDYKVHSFTADGTFTPTSVPATESYVEYLVIAGGGGGGGNSAATGGGGGGAGGYRTGVLTVTASAYSITVGDGGAREANGDNSIFSTITSTGGGQGANSAGAGQAGGSGGGGVRNGCTAGGAASPAGQGFAGGVGCADGGDGNAGGGGAGAVGEGGASGVLGGPGGVGLSSTITGSSVFRAGGGGGGGYDSDNGGAGGNGGGGAGANGMASAGTAGTPNTGGGGGGGGDESGGAGTYGGVGGSGIVIIRYKFQ